MKEIKFRAWDVTNKEMMDWDYLRCVFGLDHLFSGEYSEKMLPMQFTGIKDFYEGDIIQSIFSDGFKFTVAIKKHNAAFGYWVDKDKPWETFTTFDHILNKNVMNFEKIGNIHENPELLEA